MREDIERYYGNLHLWTRFSRRFRSFSGSDAHTIHRFLVDDETGAFEPTTIHRLIAEKLAGLTDIRGLDAGCGYGGTALDLAARCGGRWTGVTISADQARVARKQAARLGLDDRVRFLRRSYDDAADARFTVVVGIESLIHSPDPAYTAAAFAAALDPGGLFIIVDDMPVDEVPAVHREDLAAFQRLWRCPVMPSVSMWHAHLKRAGCVVEDVRDLSDRMRPRAEADIRAALEDVGRKRRWRDRLGLRSVGDAEIGGLLLERLGREGVVRYAMITARKQG